MTRADDTSGAWVEADERGLRLRVDELCCSAWHPHRPWLALAHGPQRGEDVSWWVLDVAEERVLTWCPVAGAVEGLVWRDDDTLACVLRGSDGWRVELRAVPDGGVVASARLPFEGGGARVAAGLPAGTLAVAWRGDHDDDDRFARRIGVLDRELRVRRVLDAASMGESPGADPFGPFALHPDGDAVAVWCASGERRSTARVAVVPLSRDAPARWIAVAGLQTPMYPEWGPPLVHVARWSSPGQVVFETPYDLVRVDALRGQSEVAAHGDGFGLDPVARCEHVDTDGRRVTAVLEELSDALGFAAWGVRRGGGPEGAPWRFPGDWYPDLRNLDADKMLQRYVSLAAGRLAVLARWRGEEDELAVHLVDLRGDAAEPYVVGSALVEGFVAAVTLSSDARWLLVTGYPQRGAGGSRVLRVSGFGALPDAPSR